MRDIVTPLLFIAVLIGFIYQWDLDQKTLADLASLKAFEASQEPDKSGVKISDVRLMDLKKMCSDQSDKFFKESGLSNDGSTMHSYVAHYNRNMDTCFTVISSVKTGDDNYHSIMVVDSFEGVQYAQYFSKYFTGDNKTVVTLCLYGLPPRAITCSSLEEFLGLIAIYLEGNKL